MKRFFAIMLAAALLACGLCVTAQAEFIARVYNADMVNIRSGPGSEYPWLTSIPRDGQVRVLGEYGGWYQVVTLDGSVTGYMYKDYLTQVSDNPYGGSGSNAGGNYNGGYYTGVSTSFGIVSGTENLNVRSGPGTEYSWLGSVARGEWVEITGENGNWYYATVVATGVSGYMSKNYISVASSQSAGQSNTAVVQNPSGTRFLNLRAYPSYDAEILDIFYNGETCYVLDKRVDGWWYVSANRNGQTITGYFRSEYLRLSSSASELGTVNTWKNGGNGRSLNLRDRPSVQNSGILRQIPNGSTVSVYLKGNTMWQVGYDGIVGFVDSGFLGAGGGFAPVTPEPQPQPVYGNAYVRTGNSGKLNLREQANTASRVLGRYENGTAVNVMQQGTGWCYVQVNGQMGYMMTKYLSISGSTTAKQVVNNNGGSYVNLRTSPEKTNNVNVRVPVGSWVNLLSWGQVWSQVAYGQYTGYMMSWFLK